MPNMARVGRLLSSRFWRTSVEDEVDAELEFHLEMTIHELTERGMTRDHARAEARRRFGDLETVNAQCRRFGHQRNRNRARTEYLGELRQDVVFALRQLASAPSFTSVAICTLALGIGATTAVFSALDAVVLRPLPFAAPDRVVRIQPTKRGAPIGAASGAEFAAMRDLHAVFARVGAVVPGAGFTLTGAETPEVIGGAYATADYLRLFGVPPQLGRDFLVADDEPGAPHVVILSHRLWSRKFAADPAILGHRLQLNGEPYQVIGVMPASFDVTSTGDELWAPLRLSSRELTDADGHFLQLVARLRPEVSLQRASAAINAAERVLTTTARLSEWIAPDVPSDIGATVRRYADHLVGDNASRLLLLLGAVGFVLLIACTNVANLLLARATVRARELAIRAALGAGRARLLRQLLAESVVLALLGALLGVALAYALVRGVVAIAPKDVPRLDQARVDGRVLAFTLGVTAITSILVGLLPAYRAAGAAAVASATRAGRSGGGPPRDRLRLSAVTAEVALAMTLLTGAGLLIRTAWQVQHVDPGFSPSHVLAARLLLPAARYADPASIVRTYREIQDAVTRVPGVRTASLVSAVPFSGSNLHTSVAAEGRPLTPMYRVPVSFALVSPGYFGTMRIPILEGRDIATTDVAGAPGIVIVSRSLAQKLWPGERAVGRRIDALSFERGKANWLEVVGVVGDVREATLAQPAVPTLYMPFTQTPATLWEAVQRSLVVVARTAPDPNTLLRPIRLAVTTVDPSLPLADAATMNRYLADSLATARFNTLLLSLLGLIALLLASVGVYGVVSYFVSQRTPEIGLRLALGATPANIWHLVLRRGLVPIVTGAILGTALSLATASLLRGQLYAVTPTDPLTFASVALLLLAVSVVATYLPARRAMRVPPALALTAT
jgi:predicted permease